ncbi:DJ-1/PfpI family protein [Chromobacterium alticapitis]|uniref:Thiamine biosynthesis protein ThiJ n=1 Tax=Chromobacterium alticapitis TaxID=2073169 RepID=A0A2S5DHJ0_9NEIS|nr:DJ-1/PfpI family protein [Chromobacterium alticapitis]POZ62481.1 thiamine biosynthesis protein ThiJ [Chromobacterium alticapitis]
MPSSQISKPIAVLLYPGCIFFEIALLAEELAGHAPLRYLTPDGEAHSASNGAVLAADGDDSALERGAWAAVLVPGGDPGSIVPDGLANAGLRAAAGQGAVVAGICAGNLVLAAAGLLKGRRGTHNYTVDDASPAAVALTVPYWRGMEYFRCDVVIDGRIVTAMPWAYVEFAATVMSALNLMDAAARDAFHRRHGPRLGLGA